MTDNKIEVKFKLFNIFNLAGALYGWCHTHTWTGAAWGYVGVTIGVPLVILFALLGAALCLKAVDAIADAWPMPKVRIAEDVGLRDGESQEQRWAREYAEHCKAHGLTNELGSSPIHREYDHDFTTTSTSSDTSSYYYTSSGGPG